MNNKDYCKCKKSTAVTTKFNDFYEYDICCDRGKVIEGSYRDLNHYDGEDHVYYNN